MQFHVASEDDCDSYLMSVSFEKGISGTIAVSIFGGLFFRCILCLSYE